jgi:mannose-6-phosphate isomerase-like protein (cupin superfamily)
MGKAGGRMVATAGRGGTGRDIPRFALYGEPARPGEELLHIETVRSRSQRYQWEIDAHVHQGLYQILWVARGWADVRLDEWRARVEGPVAIVVPPGVAHGFRSSPKPMARCSRSVRASSSKASSRTSATPSATCSAHLTLPLFRVALNPRFTRPFYAVPRTSAARTASG